MSHQLTVVVIAKECRPGKVKTRLCPPLSHLDAARLAAASLRDTLRVASALPATRRVLAFDGTPPTEADGFEVIVQVPGGLDERLAATFAQCHGPTLLLGMDTPQIGVASLGPVLNDQAWQRVDAWFGPARDGGFWALALAEPTPALLRGVPMSRPDTGRIQRAKLRAAGLRVAELPELRDVDTIEDVYEVAQAAPGTEFARTMARILTHTSVQSSPIPLMDVERGQI